jgi:hypothetical protein
MATNINAGNATTGAAISADTTGILALQSGSTPTTAVTIDASQNVGIGTASPAGRLEVNSSGTPKTITSFSTSNFNALGCGGSGGSLAYGTGTFLTFCNQPFADRGTDNNLTERMRIDSNGFLLIGTTSSNGDGITLRPRSSGSNTTSAINFNRASTATTGYPIVFQNGGADVGYIQMSNTLVSLVNLSDYRLKENIVPMSGSLAKVNALKPVTYSWKTDGSSGQGFVAHELQAVVPECVNGEKDAIETYIDEDGKEQTKPKYQGIDTSFLIATLTSAIQELNAKVDAQALEIQALKGVA